MPETNPDILKVTGPLLSLVRTTVDPSSLTAVVRSSGAQPDPMLNELLAAFDDESRLTDLSFGTDETICHYHYMSTSKSELSLRLFCFIAMIENCFAHPGYSGSRRVSSAISRGLQDAFAFGEHFVRATRAWLVECVRRAEVPYHQNPHSNSPRPIFFSLAIVIIDSWLAARQAEAFIVLKDASVEREQLRHEWDRRAKLFEFDDFSGEKEWRELWGDVDRGLAKAIKAVGEYVEQE